MAFTIADAMPGKRYGQNCFGERLQSIRKARGLTPVPLAGAAESTHQAAPCYETEAELPPAPAAGSLAKALNLTNDELLGLKPPGIARAEDVPETRRQWKKFQMISTLPERDQKAVVRLVNSLVAFSSIRKNGAEGERNGP